MTIKKVYPIIILLVFVACQSKPETSSNSDNGTETKQTEVMNIKPLPKKPSNPLDSLNNYLANKPGNVDALIVRAELYLKNKNLPAAAGDIKAALAIDSNRAEIHKVKGDIHYIQNQSRFARNEWTKCVKLDEKNTDCRMKLTEIYLAVKNYDKALEQVNAVIEYEPNYAPAYFFKGYLIRDYKGDTLTALQYFQKAIDLDQDYIDALDMMAVTLTNRKDTLARYYYERILELQPNRYDIYYKLGVYYTNIDEINRALEAYTKALQINPRDPESLFNLGYLHVELKQFQKAREYFNKAIKVKDRNYKAYYGRGYTFEVLGDVINAEKDYRKALEILPVYEPAKNGLNRIKN